MVSGPELKGWPTLFRPKKKKKVGEEIEERKKVKEKKKEFFSFFFFLFQSINQSIKNGWNAVYTMVIQSVYINDTEWE